MAVASSAKFHQNFWGEANGGFEVLMNNMKAGIIASKELGEFVKERITAEDGYVKGLTKLYKSTGHIPASSMGAFGPLWEVLKTMCDKLVLVHSQFVKMLTELSREIGEYHHSQKEKYKTNMRGDIDQAQESLNIYQTMEAAVHRSKKHYQHCVDHVAKAQGKVERAKADGPSNPKLGGLENRVKQEQAQMEAAKGEYQASVAKHCGYVMEHQGKMSEACTKFEALEEEHLAQMFTFMIKVARTQDTMHVGVAELFSTLNSQLDVLTVEKLLKLFVEEKGTGTEKPPPLKFRPIPVVVPNNSGLGASLEDIPVSTAKKTKKKKKKSKNADSNGLGTQAQAQPQAEAQVPEDNPPMVDAEGYSIRPEDAANISRFPDEQSNRKASSDSDSDFDDDEPERKIKTLKIRESSTQPLASVDDIKASMMSLRLGAVSPHGMKKATSSQSLNTLSTPPYANRKFPSTNSSHNLKEASIDTSQPNVASLIDIDFSPTTSSHPDVPAPLLPVAPNSKGSAQNIPAPLLPTTSSSSTSIRGGGSQIPVPLVPSAAPIPAKVSQANPSPLNFDSKSIDTTASLPVWNFSPISKPSPVPAPTDSPSNSSPSIPRPRAGSLKGQDSPVATSDSSPLGSFPAPPVPSKRRSSSARPGPISSANTIATSNSTQVSALLLPTKQGFTEPVVESDSKSKSVDSSPVLGRKPIAPDSAPTADETPPIPAPRTASLLKSPLQPSPTHMATPISPLVASQVSTHPGGVASGSTAEKVMPLAIAIHETCNAIFKGTDLSQCMVKVTGEVVMSFPASFLPLLGSYKALTFKVEAREKLERVLHHQILLKKLEGSSDYTFEMDQLSTHLKKIQEKASAPFYNVQVLKYDVDVSDASKLPLHLVTYMKCLPTTTNFRLDYTYQPGVFQTKPTMTKVAISLPVDGGVKNSITKPMGMWSAESGHMTWAIGDILPSDNPVPTPVHAKFDLSSGPSTVSSAAVTFTCEGDTVSGLSLDLTNAAYKVSLLKTKCSAGKYVAEPKSS